MRKLRLFIDDESAMIRLGHRIAAGLSGNELIFLQGELGAGKTTLTRGIAQGMGYNGIVTSPTFTIMNIYSAGTPIYHYDFYRLQTNDCYDLGWEDYVGRGGVTLVEWPEIGRRLLPRPDFDIIIKLDNDDYERGRWVIISCNPALFASLAEGLS